MNSLLLEEKNAKLGFLGDLTNGVSSSRIKLDKGDKVTVLVALADVATDLDITLRQSDAATAGNSKDLLRLNPYYKKVAAATYFTKVDVLATPAAQIVDASCNSEVGLYAFEVNGSELDADGGFLWFSVNIAHAVTNRVAAVVFVQGNCRHLPAYLLAV